MKKMSPEEVAEVCERLYDLAKSRGKETESHDSDRENGYGFRKDRQHFTLRDRGCIIVATREQWRSWGPMSDSSGVYRKLEIYRGEKKTPLCAAGISEDKRVENFSHGDERFLGSERPPTEPWEVSSGRIPMRYRSKKITK